MERKNGAPSQELEARKAQGRQNLLESRSDAVEIWFRKIIGKGPITSLNADEMRSGIKAIEASEIIGDVKRIENSPILDRKQEYPARAGTLNKLFGKFEINLPEAKLPALVEIIKEGFDVDMDQQPTSPPEELEKFERARRERILPSIARLIEEEYGREEVIARLINKIGSREEVIARLINTERDLKDLSEAEVDKLAIEALITDALIWTDKQVALSKIVQQEVGAPLTVFPKRISEKGHYSRKKKIA